MPNRQSGRINFIAILAVVGALLIVAVLFMGKQSPSEAGARFMSALAKGDAATLTDMTYMGDTPKSEIRKKWDFATGDVSKYYRFAWKIMGTSEPNDHEAAVRLQVLRNLDSGGSYEENFQLPMLKQNGQWLVDVKAINREMYPALPR